MTNRRGRVAQILSARTRLASFQFYAGAGNAHFQIGCRRKLALVVRLSPLWNAVAQHDVVECLFGSALFVYSSKRTDVVAIGKRRVTRTANFAPGAQTTMCLVVPFSRHASGQTDRQTDKRTNK